MLLCPFPDHFLLPLLLATMRWPLVDCHFGGTLKWAVLDFDFDSSSVSQMDSHCVSGIAVMRPHSLATFGFLNAISSRTECEVAHQWTTCRRREEDEVDLDIGQRTGGGSGSMWQSTNKGWGKEVGSLSCCFGSGFISNPHRRQDRLNVPCTKKVTSLFVDLEQVPT